MKKWETKIKETSSCKCKKMQLSPMQMRKKEEEVKEPIYIVICKRNY
jgi:hypothetical protein